MYYYHYYYSHFITLEKVEAVAVPLYFKMAVRFVEVRQLNE